MSVKPLPLIAFVLIVPVAVLTVLAVRSLSLENDALSERRDRLANQRMDAAAEQISERLQNLGAEVLARTQAAFATGGASALSKLMRKRVFTYAYVSKQGTQLYAATALEHQYDSARIMQDRAQDLIDKLTSEESTATTLINLGGGYTLMRCAKDSAGLEVCAAVNQAKLMAELNSGFAPIAESAGLAQVGLVDPQGTVFGLKDTTDANTTARPLKGVFQGWQLRVVEPRARATLMQSPRFLYFLAGALIAGWLAMTWMLHRSSVLKEEAAAARAGVIAQLAHELRTPLSNLKLHTDLLNRNSANSTAVQRYGVVLDDEIDRLSVLAENAIAVARGDIAEVKREAAVPDESLRAIVDRFEPTLVEARCKVALNLNADAISYFDKTSWERCIVNLIDNARKYAPGSVIKMYTLQSHDMLRLEIIDNGPGIHVDQREKIFEPLFRGSANAASGFGLGLAAVRTLARQNGGDCWIEDNRPGVKFVLTLRADRVPPNVEEPRSSC